jgi:hypothetical protein
MRRSSRYDGLKNNEESGERTKERAHPGGRSAKSFHTRAPVT